MGRGWTPGQCLGPWTPQSKSQPDRGDKVLCRLDTTELYLHPGNESIVACKPGVTEGERKRGEVSDQKQKTL